MTERPYQWHDGARLDDHTERKHRVVRQYFRKFLEIRCSHPQQALFRLAIVDGFSGGGRYKDGEAGSPIIFLEELKRASQEINVRRLHSGMKPITVECLMIFNDSETRVVELLKANTASLLADIRDTASHLHIEIEYSCLKFAEAYPALKSKLISRQYRNVLFNLDQCGHSHVETQVISDIMQAFSSAEVFLTFMISALTAFLQRRDPVRLLQKLKPFGLTVDDLDDLGGLKNTDQWLGAAERIVFEALSSCAPYVSPFAIHNPEGWQYWLIHFANAPRAREAFNDILHENSSMQAHFGRSGLNMLKYKPLTDGTLNLFDELGREHTRTALMTDIPKFVAGNGGAVPVGVFRQLAYKQTVARSDDLNHALVENTEIEVITAHGGRRRAASQIIPGDLIRLAPQASFFPRWHGKGR